MTYAIETIKKLLGRLPIFGICLGHQLLALALGAKTYKLKFGHRGANHPVKNLKTGRIEITSQNHGFCVDLDSLKDKDVELTHLNLNDNTVEGFRCKKLPGLYPVRNKPPFGRAPGSYVPIRHCLPSGGFLTGAHDSQYLFKSFTKLMD